LDSYEAERRPIATEVLRSTSALTEMVLGDTRLARVLRDYGLRERQKVETRRTLQEHALRLFLSKGYDATMVQEISILPHQGSRSRKRRLRPAHR
jgi:2-polyprenyl-6-methoxyphenol hydroxylase-like FAD-dependent oxidoreductase